MYKKIISYVLVLFAALGAVNTQSMPIGLTSVVVNGDKMVNDSVQNLTWADIASPLLHPYLPDWQKPFPYNDTVINAAYEMYHTYEVSDQEWLDSLNRSGYGGHSDWRLPTVSFESSFYIYKGELNKLFYYDLQQNPGSFSNDYQPFTSIVKGQEFMGQNHSCLITRTYEVGGTFMDCSWRENVLAVRTGVTSVPEPDTAWLFLVVLGGLGLIRYKRNK